MKSFVDKYYRLFCSKYAEDICRFINHYDFAKQEGEFNYIYDYSEWKPNNGRAPYWESDSSFTMSDIWIAIQDLFYIMENNNDRHDLFEKIIKSLCDNDTNGDSTKLLMGECESIFKYLLYGYFKLEKDSQNNKLSLGTCTHALKSFLNANKSKFRFDQSLFILKEARNRYHNDIPKPIEDSHIIRLRVIQYIVFVIVGVVAIFNKYQTDLQTYDPILEPLKVIIKKRTSANIIVTSIVWSQNGSDKKSIEMIDGAEIRDFEIKIQRHRPIKFGITYDHNGEIEREDFSISLEFNDNVDYALVICIPEAQNNYRFNNINGSFQEEAISEDEISESVDQISELSVEDNKVDIARLLEEVKFQVKIDYDYDDVESNWSLYSSTPSNDSCFGLVWDVELKLCEFYKYKSADIPSLLSRDKWPFGRHLKVEEFLKDRGVLGYFELKDVKIRQVSLSGISLRHDRFSYDYDGYLREGRYCQIQELNLDCRNADSVVIEREAFSKCKKLERIYLGNETVISHGAFRDCTQLLAVNYKEDGEYTIEDEAFMGCSSLKSIDITGKPGAYAFAGCTSLDSVNFRNGSVVKIAEGVFCGCISLEDICLPEGLEEIGESAFEGCGLKKITFPSTLKKIGKSAFASCIHLEEIEFLNISNLKEIQTLAFRGLSTCNHVGAPVPSLKYIRVGKRKFTVKEFTEEYKDLLKENGIFDYPYYHETKSVLNTLLDSLFNGLTKA